MFYKCCNKLLSDCMTLEVTEKIFINILIKNKLINYNNYY